MPGDIPDEFPRPPGVDHERREVMVPMRDGVRLFTVILVPASRPAGERAPMVLDRTPYGAGGWTRQNAHPSAAMAMYAFEGELLQAGFIVVVQDVRGKHKSEGDYVLNRPLRGPLNDTGTDHATDAHDTIDWLAANVPESNGRVGLIGVSYAGFTALMGLFDPHPALKCVVPINPMVDAWIGDDWFHHGAFRQTEAARYVFIQTGSKASELPWPLLRHDEYEAWREAGSAGEMGRRLGLDRLPAWQRLIGHPAYDAYWQAQAVHRLLAKHRATVAAVPTLHVRSQWDAEDNFGTMAAWAACTGAEDDSAPAPVPPPTQRLVIGPWSHPGVGASDGSRIGALALGSATARHFRQGPLRRFLDEHLRDGAPPAALPAVTAFETGTMVWRTHDRWPPAGVRAEALYLHAGGQAAFDAPAGADEPAFDEYVSDPAKPVPYQPRPIRAHGSPGSRWEEWLVDDQRFADGRPDVLTWVSAPLERPLHLAGAPVAHLFASTTGRDADWVVKLIDVHPEDIVGEPAMAGYQLPIAMDILRARYRDDPAHPRPVPPGEVLHLVVPLPHVSHALRPGHRLMVQVQSTWFPLYDRNPQTDVDTLFFAPPEAYVKAVHRIHRAPGRASRIDLPVLG